jgi:hypothetical protein
MLWALPKLVRGVLDSPASLKIAPSEGFHLLNELGVPHGDVDCVHSAMLASLDFLSMLTVNSDVWVWVLEFTSMHESSNWDWSGPYPGVQSPVRAERARPGGIRDRADAHRGSRGALCASRRLR